MRLYIFLIKNILTVIAVALVVVDTIVRVVVQSDMFGLAQLVLCTQMACAIGAIEGCGTANESCTIVFRFFINKASLLLVSSRHFPRQSSSDFVKSVLVTSLLSM